MTLREEVLKNSGLLTEEILSEKVKVSKFSDRFSTEYKVAKKLDRIYFPNDAAKIFNSFQKWVRSNPSDKDLSNVLMPFIAMKKTGYDLSDDLKAEKVYRDPIIFDAIEKSTNSDQEVDWEKFASIMESRTKDQQQKREALQSALKIQREALIKAVKQKLYNLFKKR